MIPRRPRALVLTLSFGSGHLRAAAAVAEALRADATNADIRVIDALEGCNPVFRAFYVWPYWLMIRYAPSLWDRFFAARLRNKTDKTAPAWAFWLGCQRVFRAIADFDPESKQFANPVHCVTLAANGLVYVCDRRNNRVQVFHKDGSFVRQYAFDPKTLGSGSSWGVAFSPLDKEQAQFVLLDGTNNEMKTVRVTDGAVLGTTGRPGRQAGAEGSVKLCLHVIGGQHWSRHGQAGAQQGRAGPGCLWDELGVMAMADSW